MGTGKILRLRRIFSKGRAVILPIDHALYSGPIKGIENLEELVSLISPTQVDAIVVTPATLKRIKDVIGDLAAVARIDGTYTRLGSHPEKSNLITTVEQAVAEGADMAIINVFVGTENEHEMLTKLGNVATACSKWGLPLMAEMVPAYLLEYEYAKEKKAYDVERATDEIRLASRLGAELGADIIKTYYTGSVDTFKEVVSTTPVPIVMAGGSKSGEDRDFLRFVYEVIQAGAKGICSGRNVWQRENIHDIISACCHIVHGDASLEEATRFI